VPVQRQSNTDIAGIGVRISMYVQTFLAGESRCLSIPPCSSTISRGYHCIAFIGRNLQPNLHIYNHEHFCHRRSLYPRLLFGSSNQPTRVHTILYTHMPTFINQYTDCSPVVPWFFTIIPLIVLHIADMKLRHRNKISNAINSSS
jgi:hypothetical protein